MLPTDTDSTPAEAIQRAAWSCAVDLHRRWADALKAASGGPGGMGHRDPWAEGQVGVLRTQLDEVVALYGWEQTYPDPMVNDWNRTCYLSPVWPPVKLGDARHADWAATSPIEELEQWAADPFDARDRAADEAEFGR